MAATLMPNGKNQFFDSNGPLSGGKLYTYEAGTSTPKATWVDSAKLAANTNPIILDARGEASIYWDGNYKVVLTDADDVGIYTQDPVKSLATAEDIGVIGEMSDPSSNSYRGPWLKDYSALRSYSGTGAVQVRCRETEGDGGHGEFYYDSTDITTADNDGTVLVGVGSRRWKRKYTGLADPKWWGATGDGVTNDRTALSAMFAVTKRVSLSGRYNLGTLTADEIVFDLTNGGDAIVLETSGIVEFICESAATGVAKVLFVADAVGVRIGRFKLTDNAASRGASSGTATGAVLLYLWGYDDPVEGLDVDYLFGANTVSPLIVGGYNVAGFGPRVRGARISYIGGDNSYYGANFQNQGDGFEIDLIDVTGSLRAYFAYGVQDHDVTIQDYSGLATSGNVNISCMNGERDTRNIRIKYLSRSSASAVGVLLNQIGPNYGTIAGIRIELDYISTVSSSNAVALRVYDSSGGPESVVSTNAIFDDIAIHGTSSGPGSHLSFGSYAVGFNNGRKSLTFGDSIAQTAINAAVQSQFRMNGGGPKRSGSYTPVLSGQSSAGTATYSIQRGDYVIQGNLCFFALTLSWSSHTGTGNMTISNAIPYLSKATSGQNNAFAIQPGFVFTSGYALSAGNPPNSQTINPVQTNPATGAIGGIAITASGYLTITGVYELATSAL
ncbi:hypothetical protein N8I74_15740 [Chitiniphilus purpureus]|uniref:Tail fiber protein n=1 Tax=Chitiniphilus purpureus TaxID=2981137 RepID=A0ABY6DK71_9NEIS|nr:hypothetical protein [Chitiniphilus sp. CD1]UXY14755.1 hypothetical protein N8I74_15740 [Chitiniphilus sp. CD1]